MKAAYLVSSTALIISLFATGCGADKTASTTANPSAAQKQEAPAAATATNTEKTPEDYSKAAKELVEELEKGKTGGKVDWDQAQKLYGDLTDLVQRRDSENESQVNEQLTAAMKAGKDGTLTPAVVAELHEKLMQKVAFQSIRHDFKEANEKFTDKQAAKDEVKEATGYYEGFLKGMVEKRDAAYSTTMITAIEGGFHAMDEAIDKGDNLAFNLGKQVVDKTMMKAFYLASGAEKGYGYKLEKEAKEGTQEDIKAEQAEGWAFFQSLYTYLAKADKEDADYINQQFDLSNDVKNIKGDLINQAFVRAFANTAKGEYQETMENWGKDKAVITAMEGALFIDVIKADLPKALGGEAQAKALLDNAQKLLDEVKAGNKDKATALHKQVNEELDKLAKYGKQ